MFCHRPNLPLFPRTENSGNVEGVGLPFALENCAMTTPQGSPAPEQLNRMLLQRKEGGWQGELQREWFGTPG